MIFNLVRDFVYGFPVFIRMQQQNAIIFHSPWQIICHDLKQAGKQSQFILIKL